MYAVCSGFCLLSLLDSLLFKFVCRFFIHGDVTSCSNYLPSDTKLLRPKNHSETSVFEMLRIVREIPENVFFPGGVESAASLINTKCNFQGVVFVTFRVSVTQIVQVIGCFDVPSYGLMQQHGCFGLESLRWMQILKWGCRSLRKRSSLASLFLCSCVKCCQCVKILQNNCHSVIPFVQMA